VPKRGVLAQLFVTLLPLLFFTLLLGLTWDVATAPKSEVDTAAIEINTGAESTQDSSTGLASPPVESTGLAEPPAESGTGVSEPPSTTSLAESPSTFQAQSEAAPAPAPPGTPAPPPDVVKSDIAKSIDTAALGRLAVPQWFWIMLAICAVILGAVYFLWTWERLEIFKMLLTSFFPLALLILAVLGSIVFGLATPTEAAAVGAFGGFFLAVAYRFIDHWRRVPRGEPKARAVRSSAREVGGILKESSYLTAKTSAMVCWLFVGSAIFSAAFALLGGQELVEKWVLSMDLTPLQFMLLAQAIIFILGWPLEWTEIIVIFMPIFIPLLPHFGVDPLFFGLLVALNLQTAFLSPPVAMAAFYLKGVAPRHVTLNQIFAGMMPFMIIQVIALALLYIFPGIGLWLPQTLYK
jgi:TRAP-type mannitol/chloroaromatic compound transport system permease large subunit